ncbi:MAG: binding-protein-dependent transport systems inner membrane component [Anaerolineae bacterium]|jgi:peptide/nickel transport system permease protein|nr:MAG: binding-protein-dependent transport systems inner membrane component [Anaerolineae bacterium]
MMRVRNLIGDLLRYPSAIIGILVVLTLIGVATYTVIKIPYREAIRLWRGGEDVWYQNPKYAAPAWLNYFYRKKQPISFAVNSAEGEMQKTIIPADETISTIELRYSFEFQYDEFPQDLILYFRNSFVEKSPFVSVMWITPDEREVRIVDMAVDRTETFRFSQDQKLQKRLKTQNEVIPALFSDPNKEGYQPLKGKYTLVITATTFEPNADVNAEFVLHGKLYGLAGTDQYRRDITLALLWGTPIALAFGLLASLGTSLLSMIIAAIGTWYAGWVDELIQRITEINLVLPFLAILIMVGTFYSRSIWVILGVTILLSIFSGAIKTYRAIFMQSKESPYIEAARAYGASNLRIIFAYLIPRMIPLLIPSLVSSVPSYVFLEASLAVLGLGDPVLPTWGKVIENAFTDGALYRGLYYWVLEPAVLLMLTGLGFAMLGFALDRVFNPRLRDI